MDILTHIAGTRFGLGHIHNRTATSTSKSAILEQARRRPFIPSGPNAEAIIADILSFQSSARSAAMAGEVLPPEKRVVFNKAFRQSVDDRLARSVQSEAPFRERLVQFWSNHFAIDAKSLVVRALAPDFENTAIAPFVGGRFADLLKSALLHPAMLIYLDQVNSIGPNSFAGQRGRKARELKGKKAGLNENLAREILELHMMGARSGYSQDDVRQLALALTGRTIAGINGKTVQQIGYRFGVTYFDTQLHEPGIRKILDQNFLDHGEAQATNIIKYIARLPQTATFLATKLARHFVADTPPEDLVNALASAYLDGNGSLSALYRTLIAHPAAWSVKAQKILTPWEWTIAAFRALSLTREQSGMRIEAQLADMGQTIWTPRSPAGFGDSAAAWLSPSMMMQRAQIAQRLAVRARRGNGPPDQNSLLRQRRYNPDTLTILRGAASMDQWTVLALMAPEFVRR